VCTVDDIVVVVLHAILSEALLQPLGEGVDLALGFSKSVTILLTLLLAFLGLEKSVTHGQNTFSLCASPRPLTPECERFVRRQLRGSFGNNLIP
jgi:hypothetical protein